MSSSFTPLTVVTTATIDGHPVREYLGIVSAEAGLRYSQRPRRFSTNSLRDHARAHTMEQKIHVVRDLALAMMIQRAMKLSATAIVAVDIDYANIQMSDDAVLLLISATGTAVIIS